MTHNQFSLEFMPGKHATKTAMQVFARAIPRYQQTLLWDTQPKFKPDLLFQTLPYAPLVAICTVDRVAIGFAWLWPFTCGSYAHTPHVFFGQPYEKALEVGKAFYAECKARHYYNFHALVPVPYRHVISYASKLGFEKIARLKEACHLYLNEQQTRHCDGWLLSLNLEEHNPENR